MTFAEFVPVLKEYFKRTISNDELCGILFDAIITLADVRNRNGEIFIVDKADISRILNRKKNIPNALRNHAWDKSVQDGIDKYFETRIVAKLVPDTSDLFYRLMSLIDADENISPIRKEQLRNIGKESIGAFLKEIFLYTLRQENKSARTTEIIKPKLNIKDNSIARQNHIGFFNFPAGYMAALRNMAALQNSMAVYNSPYYQTVCRMAQSFR